MSDSLRDQLLKAGLVTGRQVQEAERHRTQQQFHTRRNVAKDRRDAPSAADVAAGKQQAEKAARDAELNRRQQEKAERKARHVEVRRLVEQHRLPRADADESYSFVHEGKVRRIAADAALRARLSAGELTLVRCDGRYEIVPATTAEKIREREPQAVVQPGPPAAAAAETDPAYRDFVVPDDLRW